MTQAAWDGHEKSGAGGHDTSKQRGPAMTRAAWAGHDAIGVGGHDTGRKIRAHMLTASALPFSVEGVMMPNSVAR